MSEKGYIVIVTQNGRTHRDGEGRNWTYAQAEQHVKRCEYDANNIKYEIKLIEDDTLQPAKYNTSGQSSRKRSSG